MDELESNHSYIVDEFKKFIHKYEISHNKIKKSILNHIEGYDEYNKIQVIIDKNYDNSEKNENISDTDNEESDSDNEESDSEDENNSEDEEANCFGGGICMYVKDNIPAKQLMSHKDDTESIFLEINIRLRKWLIVGAYKPPDQSKTAFLESLSKNLSTYLDTYENILMLGDFNMTPEDKNMQLFADCFKSLEKNQRALKDPLLA